MSGGSITLTGAPCDHLGAFIETVGRTGVSLNCGRDTIEVDGSSISDGGVRAVDIETAPYPGLATDLQPPTSVLLTQARGVSQRPRGDLRGPPRMVDGAQPDGRESRDP